MERIYIVEDSAIVRGRIISMIMSVEGVDIVGTAETMKEASDGIFQSNPDTVILDIRLNDGNGIDLLQQIKVEKPLIKVIMLTNYNIPLYEKRCKELGADYFFDKSKDFEKILEVITGEGC
jgi:two-component system response regulator DevR